MGLLAAIDGARGAASAVADVYHAQSTDNAEFDDSNQVNAAAQSTPSYIPDPTKHITPNRAIHHPENRHRAVAPGPNIQKRDPTSVTCPITARKYLSTPAVPDGVGQLLLSHEIDLRNQSLDCPI